MVATLASAATLPFIGRIVDTLTIARVCLLIGPALAIGALMLSFGTSIVALAAAIYLLRLFGQGMMTHTAMTAMGKWFAANRGRAVSLATIGLQVGEAILPAVVLGVSALLGWRGAWIVIAVGIAFVATPIIWRLMRDERVPQGEASGPSGFTRHWTRAEVLRDPLFWLVCVGVLVPPFAGTSIFFHQDYLMQLNGWSPSLYYGSFALMAATTFVFALATGWAVDRFSAVRLLPVFFVPLGLSCVVLGTFDQSWAVPVGMFLLGTSYGISGTLLGAAWPEMYGTRHLGAVRSTVTAMMVFLTAAGPGATGLLIDRGVPFPQQLQVIGGYCFAVTLVMLYASSKLMQRRGVLPVPA